MPTVLVFQVDVAFQEAAQLALALDNNEAEFIPETITLSPTTAATPKKSSGCC